MNYSEHYNFKNYTFKNFEKILETDLIENLLIMTTQIK